MLNMIQGHVPEHMLFVPRLDLWYNRNKARQTLPAGFEQLSIRETTAKLGLGFHSVVPDFIRSVPEEAVYHRALGFYNNPDFPYRVDFSHVDFEVEKSETELKMIYHSSMGAIITKCKFGRELLASGVSIPDITEHAIKAPEDYLRLADILSKVRIESTPCGYEAYRDRVGQDGIAVAFLSLACGPMQHVMRDLRKYEEFIYDMVDEAANLSSLCEHLAHLYDQILETVLQTSAEVAIFGANYDETITFPPFFKEHIVPWLNRAYDKLHGAGKFLLTHTDGENKGLLSALKDCRLDIADSICPAPMTKVTLLEYRNVFGKKTTIWGGIPSNIMLTQCCSEEDFRRFVRELVRDCKPYDRLILSIADTTPPDADFGRLQHLIDTFSKNSV